MRLDSDLPWDKGVEVTSGVETRVEQQQHSSNYPLICSSAAIERNGGKRKAGDGQWRQQTAFYRFLVRQSSENIFISTISPGWLQRPFLWFFPQILFYFSYSTTHTINGMCISQKIRCGCWTEGCSTCALFFIPLTKFSHFRAEVFSSDANQLHTLFDFSTSFAVFLKGLTCLNISK